MHGSKTLNASVELKERLESNAKNLTTKNSRRNSEQHHRQRPFFTCVKGQLSEILMKQSNVGAAQT